MVEAQKVKEDCKKHDRRNKTEQILGKTRLFMRVWAAVLLLCNACFAESAPMHPPRICAESFDCAPPAGWGFHSMPDTEEDFVGLTPAQRTDISRHPEHWLKAWIRLYAQPGIRGATVSFFDADHAMNPLYYGNLLFGNVRIHNMDEIGVYPHPWMVFAANPAAFLAQPAETDGDWWYLEVMIEKRNRREDEIAQSLRRAEITCDAYMQKNEKYDMQANLPVDLSSVARRVLWAPDAVSIRAEQCIKSEQAVAEIFANYDIDEALLIEAQNHPERFRCYALQMTLANHSPYDLCSLDDSSALCDQQGWLMYFDTEFRGPYSCQSGAAVPLEGYYLILRDPEFGGSSSMPAADEIPLSMMAHTEFAGILRKDEAEGTLGYDGIPFAVDVDMSNCTIE